MGCGSSSQVHDSASNAVQNDQTAKRNQVVPVPVIAKKVPAKDIVVEDLLAEPEDESWVKISASAYSVQEWREMIKSLLADTNLKLYAHAKSRTSLGSIENLRKYLAECPYADSDVKKAWLAYLWITEFVSYDVMGYLSGNRGDNTSPGVFSRGQCVCDGYSSLFFDLCNSMGLTCKKLIGYSKAAGGYSLGDKFKQDDHAWNMVRLDGKWQLVECTWAAGHTQGYSFVKRFEPHYFCTPPQIFIYDHLPVGDASMNQRLDRPIELSQFEQMAKLDLKYHVQGFECLSHTSGKLLIESKTNPLLLEFKIPKDSKLMLKLKLRQSDRPLPDENVVLQYDRGGQKAAAFVMLDLENERYELSVMSNSPDRSNTYSNFAEYLVVRNGSQPLTKIPRYELTFGDTYQVECLSHKSLWITSEQSPLKMEFKNFGDNFMDGHLVELKTGQKYDKSVLKQLNPLTNKIELLVNLPAKDRLYILKVDCGVYKGTSWTYQSGYAKFFISTLGATSSSSFKPDFKFTKIESKECYVYEPLAYELKSGLKHTFKIHYKNADSVWLEDSNQVRKYFKTSDDQPDIWTLAESYLQPQEIELKIRCTNEVGRTFYFKAGSYQIVA